LEGIRDWGLGIREQGCLAAASTRRRGRSGLEISTFFTTKKPVGERPEAENRQKVRKNGTKKDKFPKFLAFYGFFGLLFSADRL